MNCYHIRSVLPLIINIGSKVSFIVATFINLWTISEYYGLEAQGIVSVSNVLISFAGLVGGFSIGRVIPYELKKRKKEPNQFFSDFFFSFLILIFVLSLITALILLVFLFLKPSLLGTIPLKSFLFFTPLIIYYIWLPYGSIIFSSIDKLMVQSVIVIIVQSCIIILLFLGAYYKISFIYMISVFVGLRVIGTFIEIIYLISISKLNIQISGEFLRSIVTNGLKIHLDSISGFFLTSASIIILNLYLPLSEMAKIDWAQKLAMVFMIFPQTIQLSVITKITILNKTNNIIDKKNLFKLIFKTIVFLTILVSVVYILIIILIKTVFISTMFVDIANLFKYYLIIIIINGAITLINPFWIDSGRFKSLSILTILLSVVNLFFLYQLIPKVGTFAAPISSIITYFLAGIINVLFMYNIYIKRNKTVHRENIY